MKLYKINVSKFIRDAVKEKIEREYSELITNYKNNIQ